MLTSLCRTTASISIQDLAARLGTEVEPDVRLEITGVAPIDQAGPSEISFVADPAYARHAATSQAGALLVGQDFDTDVPMLVLRVANPRLAYATALEALYSYVRPQGGVHPTAVVPASCKLAPEAVVGPYVVLGEDVEIGAGSVLHPHVVVYDGCRIGADCVIHSGAVLREHSRLGDRVVIQNGAIIGADGFGYAPMRDRSWHKIPQAGSVDLADDVEIQAAACIDRAAVGTTSVGRGTKIDNLVQVGHGCRIGEDTLLCGQVGLAGSTTVGNRVMVGGQVGSAGHLTIGDDVSIAAQSGLMSDLEAGKTYMGSPALEGRYAKSVYLLLTRLPELAKRIRKLERAVETPDAG